MAEEAPVDDSAADAADAADASAAEDAPSERLPTIAQPTRWLTLLRIHLRIPPPKQRQPMLVLPLATIY